MKEEVDSKSKNNYFLWIIAALILISIVSATIKNCSKELFVSTNETTKDTLGWKLQEVGFTGLLIEIPFDLKISKSVMPIEVQSLIKDTQRYGYNSNNFAVDINYIIYSDKIEGNLEAGATEAIRRMRDVEGVGDFRFESVDIYRNGINGKLLKGHYQINKQLVGFRGVIFLKNPKMWTAMSIYLDNEENIALSEKIIGSISISLDQVDHRENSHQKKDESPIIKGKLLKKLNLEMPIGCVAVSKNKKLIAIGDNSDDPFEDQGFKEKFKVSILSTNDYSKIYSLVGHEDKIEAMDFSSDSKKLVSTDSKGNIIIWDLVSGLEIKTIKTNHWIHNVKFTNESKTILAVMGFEKKALVYSLSGELIKTLMVDHQIEDFEINTKKHEIYFACFDEIQVWSLEKYEKINSIPYKRIRRIKLGHNKEIIALGLSSGDVVLLNKNLIEIAKYSGHFKPIMDINFSPNDKLIGSASSDQTARIWDLENQSEILQLMNEHNGTVNAISFVSESRFITGGENKELKIWE